MVSEGRVGEEVHTVVCTRLRSFCSARASGVLPGVPPEERAAPVLWRVCFASRALSWRVQHLAVVLLLRYDVHKCTDDAQHHRDRRVACHPRQQPAAQLPVLYI